VLGSSIALNILFGIPLWAGVLITIVDTFLILLMKQNGMRILEIMFASMLFVIACCFFINLILIGADIGELFKGLFIPVIKTNAETPMLGLIGSVLMPHNLYLHSALVQTREIDRKNKVEVKESIIYFNAEAAVSLFISFLINATLISTFAFWYGKGYSITLSNAGDIFSQ